jgi:hypothetical protein
VEVAHAASRFGDGFLPAGKDDLPHIHLGDPPLSTTDTDKCPTARWAARLTVSSFCVHNRSRRRRLRTNPLEIRPQDRFRAGRVVGPAPRVFGSTRLPTGRARVSRSRGAASI